MLDCSGCLSVTNLQPSTWHSTMLTNYVAIVEKSILVFWTWGGGILRLCLRSLCDTQWNVWNTNGMHTSSALELRGVYSEAMNTYVNSHFRNQAMLMYVPVAPTAVHRIEPVYVASLNFRGSTVAPTVHITGTKVFLDITGHACPAGHSTVSHKHMQSVHE
jgi:hypothetical protein